MRKPMLHSREVKALQVFITVLLIFFFSIPAAGSVKEAVNLIPTTLIGLQAQGLENETWVAQRRKAGPESEQRTYERLPPDERERLRGRSRKWEGLPQEKRRELERRMDRWQQLPPEERDLIRKRHQQWQELSPEEQERIRERLDRWDTLPPQEQEEIRRKFKRP